MCSMPRRCAAISPCAARAPARSCWRSTARPTRSTTAMCVIADDDGVESLAGIMGGEETGCSETTTDVLIESALWDADQHRPDRPQARHQFRRALSLRARRRSGLHAARARTGDADGARSLRRHAVGDHRRRRGRGARDASIDFPLAELKRLAGLDVPLPEMRARAGAARLLRRRAGRAREGRGAVVAARRRRARPTSSRRSCASSASTACPLTPFDAATRRASRCSRRSRCAPARPSARSPRAAWSRR